MLKSIQQDDRAGKGQELTINLAKKIKTYCHADTPHAESRPKV